MQVWIDSTAYNHCFLILPLIGFLLWERRAVIASVSPRPALWPLLLMPLLSAVWLIAAVLDIQEGRQLVMIAMFEVVVLIVLGLRLFWLAAGAAAVSVLSGTERRLPCPVAANDHC